MPVDRDLEGALSLVTFFGQAKKVTRPPGWRAKPNRDERTVVASARHAKNEKTKSKWIPAFAGMTELEGLRRNDGTGKPSPE
jgi:hypothetical protein